MNWKRRKQKEFTWIWISSSGWVCIEVSKGWIVLVKTGSREVYELKKYGELLTPPVQLNQLASGHIFFKLHYQLCAGFPAHWLTIHQGKTLLCQMAGPCCCYCTCNFKWKFIKLPQKADCSSLIPSAGEKWRQKMYLVTLVFFVLESTIEVLLLWHNLNSLNNIQQHFIISKVVQTKLRKSKNLCIHPYPCRSSIAITTNYDQYYS